MNLDDYLAVQGIDLASVVALVNEAVGVSNQDALFAVGSLAEGLGNVKSDIDLVLITERTGPRQISEQHVAMALEQCLVDMHVVARSEYEKLVSRLVAWSGSQWDVSHAVDFTIDERILLHRLAHAKVIYPTERPAHLGLAAIAPDDVARLKLHVARQMSRTIQVDLAGYRECGDYRSMVFASQELLGHAADALLAGYRLTNPLTKWRCRLQNALPSNWEAPLGVRPTGLSAQQRFWQMHRAPREPDRRAALTHALEITTFARAAFLWAELVLIHGRKPNGRRQSWPTEDWSREQSLPFLDVDIDYVVAAATDEIEVMLGRLNEVGRTLAVTEVELALALLFDGVTTAHAAEQAVGGRTARPSHVERLWSRLEASQLLANSAAAAGA